jgi:radical SAM-linked protein
MSQEELSTTPAPPAKALYRVRLVYARRDALRYVSHLDMQLVWERTLRRAGMPLAYSQGFNPHPRLHLASALPLGFLSRCEMTDFWIDLPAGSPAPDLSELSRSIQASAPPELEIQKCTLIPLSEPALQTQVQSSEYLATPLDPLSEGGLSQAVVQLLSATQLPRERHRKPGTPGKLYDLRPLIEALEIQPGPALFMRLSAREGATGRPEEVLAALGEDPASWRVERLKLLLA